MTLESEKRGVEAAQPQPQSRPSKHRGFSDSLERELVEAAKVDLEAFGKLYDLHFNRIYNYAYYRTRCQTEAEDVTAQTFQQALEHIGSYEWRGIPFAAWLYRIASNVVASRYRGQLPRTDLDEARALLTRDLPPEEQALKQERAREVRAAVATLPESQQQAVVLKFAQGLRNKEIGDVMGCSEGAVKQLLHRAMENLRRRVER